MTNTTDPRVEAVADELAKHDGWLSLRHPSPATQKTLRKHAAVVLASVDAAAPARKPRTITTVEELDELPVGSILRLTGDDMPDDAAIKVRHELHDESFEHSWEVSGSTENFTNAQMLDDTADTVMTVLWEPETDPLVAVAEARMANDNGVRHALEDVEAELGEEDYDFGEPNPIPVPEAFVRAFGWRDNAGDVKR